MNNILKDTFSIILGIITIILLWDSFSYNHIIGK